MADHASVASPEGEGNPWPALWALVIGFFMILVDSTIVSVATPALIRGLHADVNAVVWVTSAYLLAYAVPLLITGRLGDRVGPKNVYLTGLGLFTAASLACGLSGSIESLIIARVFQGLGAAMMTPQTMAVITRTFPANQRGKAMSLWGATAGVATLVGPILGGILVDALGWEWIFIINVPVGVVGFALAMRLVPQLPTHTHRFDLLGVALSAVGMFLLVFGIQEGQTYDWGTITGPISVWSLIIAGLLVIAAFVYWQARNTGEPLVPLSLFSDRNFSLANVAISTVGLAITAMAFPLMLWAQSVRGLSPTQSALLLTPMAVITLVLSPPVGSLADRVHPRWLAGTGIAAFIVSMVWLSFTMSPTVPIWRLLLPIALLGIANGLMWAPLTSTATRNLPLRLAGAGSGVYNTTRQVGAVLGSAAVAALMEARISAELPMVKQATGGSPEAAGGTRLPLPLRDGFSDAMAQSMLLPAAVLVIGLIATLFFARPAHVRPRAAKNAAAHKA